MRVIKDKEIDLDSNPIQRCMKRCFNITTNLHGNAFFVKQPSPKMGKMVQFMTLFFGAAAVEICRFDICVRFHACGVCNYHVPYIV